MPMVGAPGEAALTVTVAVATQPPDVVAVIVVEPTPLITRMSGLTSAIAVLLDEKVEALSMVPVDWGAAIKNVL
jgi:hypothetical protein